MQRGSVVAEGVSCCKGGPLLRRNALASYTPRQKYVYVFYKCSSLVMQWCVTGRSRLHQKLLGGGFSTPAPPFSLICTISSELNGIMD